MHREILGEGDREGGGGSDVQIGTDVDVRSDATRRHAQQQAVWVGSRQLRASALVH